MSDGSVRALLAPMIEREVELEGGTFRVNRARVLARMAAPGVEHRRWLTSVTVLAAAAAVFLAMTPAWWSRRARETLGVSVAAGSAVHFESATGDRQTLVETQGVPSRGALETGARSRAQITTPDGLEIELQSNTRVTLDALRTQESRLDLGRGAVRCVVAPRPMSRPFQVVAPEVTVIDLGTIFTVQIDETTGATSVTVEEGAVLVKHRGAETRLKAPGTWSSLDPVAAPPPTAPVIAVVRGESAQPSPSQQSSSPARKHERSLGSAPPPPRAMPAATLGEESSLLRLGLTAERQGHAKKAISTFEQFLSRYPNSPLAPDAREAIRRVEQSAPR